jgi:lysyl-tRNA synthetase class 2
MPSTVIRSFEYRPESRELEVTFTTGRRYIYSDVPQEVAAALRASRTKGIYFNKQIRPNYHYREMSSAAA